MQNKIRVGTRKSPLALWQAQTVAKKIQEKGIETEIVPISSEGDINLKQPIYKLGITGVFTRSLDIALLNNEIDIAVHSLKDVPTELPEGIVLSGYIERGNPSDILVYKSENVFEKEKRIIATGSLRRSAFWKNKFPQDEIVDLRGNVQLRLQKLSDNNWDGAVFAYAGLDRSDILPNLKKERNLLYQKIEFMTPASSQGIVGITSLTDFELPKISNKEAEICATVERQFLNILEGGCTAPIGAFAQIEEENICFKGVVLSLNGKEKIEIEETFSKSDYLNKGKELAQKCIEQGADKIIQEIKKNLSN